MKTLSMLKYKIHYTAFIFFTCLAVVMSYTMRSESLHYYIMKSDKQIGNIHIERIVKNNTTEYLFESSVKMNLLLNLQVYDKMKVVFKGKQMVQADLYRTVNGKVKVDNHAHWNGKHYEMTDMDDNKMVVANNIEIATANLYYTEPVNYKEVFSEKFQKMVPVQLTGNKRYTLSLPNGNKTSYSYANGKCKLVEADTDWASLKFVLVK